MKSSRKVRDVILHNERAIISVLAILIIGFCIFLLMFSAPISNYLRINHLIRNDSAIAAENHYCVMEENLRIHLENYESLHPGYNEYIYELDDIGHEPYVLFSILSALHGESFSFAEVQVTLDLMFDKQYVITERVDVKRRYVKGEETDYYVCTVRLDNFDLAQIPGSILNDEQLSIYVGNLNCFESRMRR